MCCVSRGYFIAIGLLALYHLRWGHQCSRCYLSRGYLNVIELLASQCDMPCIHNPTTLRSHYQQDKAQDPPWRYRFWPWGLSHTDVQWGHQCSRFCLRSGFLDTIGLLATQCKGERQGARRRAASHYVWGQVRVNDGLVWEGHSRETAYLHNVNTHLVLFITRWLMVVGTGYGLSSLLELSRDFLIATFSVLLCNVHGPTLDSHPFPTNSNSERDFPLLAWTTYRMRGPSNVSYFDHALCAQSCLINESLTNGCRNRVWPFLPSRTIKRLSRRHFRHPSF